MDLTFSVTRSDVEAFCAHYAQTRQQRFYRVMWWWALMLLAVLTAIQVLRGRPWSFGFWASVTFLWVLFGRRCFIWFSGLIIHRSLNRSDLGSHVGEQHLSCQDVGLRYTTAGTETLVNWSAIKRIGQTDSHAFIYLSDISAVTVPRESVTSGTFDDFLADVNKRISAA